MAVLTIAKAINDGLRSALQADDRVILLGEDIGKTGGVFRITDGLQGEFGAERVVDMPVAEAGIVGSSFGLAVAGMRPVAEIQFMGFSYPAYNQVINHVARIRHRSRHRFTAPLVIRIPYGGGIGAAEHHSESMESIYTHIPGLKVVVPSTPSDAKGLLLSAVADPDPVIFLEPIRLYRSVKQEVPEEHFTIPIGKAEIRRDGSDVTIVSYGAMMREVNEAAELLAGEDVSCEVIDLRSLTPLDIETVVESVTKTGHLAIVNEAPRTGGFAGELAAEVQERAFYSLEAPILRLTGWDTVFPLKRSESLYLPNAREIASAVKERLLEV
jgi:pyruvate dehydrogenase E1 component beta subunit